MAINKFAKINIFNIRSLSPASNFYKPEQVKYLTSMLRQNNGDSMALVHPLFCARKDIISERLSNNTILASGVKPSAYTKYLTDLRNKLKEVSIPVFVLYDGQKYMKQWIQNINENGTYIFVKTRKYNDPTPILSNNDEVSWFNFRQTLHSLNVKKMTFTGELYFKCEAGYYGCVLSTFDEVSKSPHIKTHIDSDLVFPNTFMKMLGPSSLDAFQKALNHRVEE